MLRGTKRGPDSQLGATALQVKPGGSPLLRQDCSPAHNVTVWLEELARSSGWLTRVAYLDGDRRWSYEEVAAAVASSATLLEQRGACAGRPVLIATQDRIAFVLAFLGAARLGAIALPVNPRLGSKQHAFMVADAKPTLAVCEGELAGHFPGVETLSADELEALGPSQPPAPPASLPPDALLYGLYTSGTTGKPKLALHRHSDVAHHAAVLRATFEPNPDDVLYSVSRAYFSYGLGNSLLCVLSTGVAAVLQRELPTVEAVSQLVATVRPTVLFAVPTFYAVLLAEGDASKFASLRVCLSAGEALAPALQERAAAFLGAPVLNGLGATEVGGPPFISNTLGNCRPGTLGKAMPGYELSVRDELGVPVPPGEVGTLWVKGPTVMVGYHNRPEENALTLVGDWLCTGDRVSLGQDGDVHYHGRKDDLEMVGGISVAPTEIEGVLLGHPAVEEAAVVALPDAIGATRLQAFVVAAPGQAPSAELGAALLQLVRTHLVAYMVPRSVTFVDALPRTPSGKLQRHVLRAGWPPEGGATDGPAR